ncbi:hypothetical protein [Nitrosococcus watsonii]|nr:hypothetical protein [Nitrosococcus watsonii]
MLQQRVLVLLQEAGIEAAIAPKANRIEQREYDEEYSSSANVEL